MIAIEIKAAPTEKRDEFCDLLDELLNQNVAPDMTTADALRICNRERHLLRFTPDMQEDGELHVLGTMASFDSGRLLFVVREVGQ